ncbi:MAG: amidase, partial [Betaproteobacteria bacterium]
MVESDAASKMGRPSRLTATEIVAGIAGGRLTCERVVRDCLEEIEAREAQIQAWQY